MIGKLICFAALATAMLLGSLSLYRQAGRRDRIVFGALVGVVCYLGLLFVAHLSSWPNLDKLFDLLASPANAIVKRLQPASS